MAELLEPPGGAGPVNEGERRLVAALLEHLPSNYLIAPNVEIADPGRQRYEFDAIVVAPHAVYVIEIKDWWGTIEGDERDWLVNGDHRKAPLPTIERKAKVLKSKLVEYMPALARVRVEAAVVVTGAATLQLTGDGGYRVYRPDELLAFLEDPAEIGQRPSAIAELSGHIRRALYKWLRGPSGPLTFGPYEVIERLEQGDDEALYRARHRQMPGAPPVRLRVVTLSPYRLTPEQLAERRAALYREAEALLRMGSHPNVVAARDVFEEDGRVVLVMDTTEGRTLRQRLRDGTPLTLEERLNILFDVSQALAHAHAHGVVHRQVEPSNILLGDDGVTRLAQFGLAKIMDSGVATVWHADTPDAVDVHYLAPELMNLPGDAVTPSTDLFELGVVGFELFSGRLPFERPSDAFSGLPPLPAGASKELTDLFAHLLRGDPAARPVDAREVLGTLARLRSDEGRRIVTGPKNEYSPGDTIDGKFEVRERLGGGGFSTVYRVYWAIEDREYALKVFNQDVPYEKVQREIAMLRAISHPRVVQAVWADRTSSGQWYLVSELIQGETLEAYTDGRKRLSVAEAVALTCQLLSALEAIHPNAQRRSELEEVARSGDLTPEQFEELQALRAQGIVHRDIKPQNLMLTSAGIVLIDFNIATQVGKPVNTMSSTPPYQCPDIIPGVDVWDVSPDLFASGVVLYELLCAEHPYENRHPRVDRQPRDPREFRPELSPDLAEFLLRACSPRRDMRFTTAREMRAALEAIDPLVVAPVLQVGSSPPSRLAQLLADAPPNVNPMVREFLALSSQARRSNRGTRGLDELADATYVETALDSRLSASVLSGQFRLVIVTGNAGDGKTAFIQQLEKAARQAGAQVVDTSKNGARLLYGGCDIVTLYDGSQDEAERTSDEVLTAFFEPFAAHRAPSVGPSMVRIAAINEGRLRDYLMTHRADYAGFAVDVIAALDDPGSSQLPGDIAVVNLNLRSVTHGGPKSIFSRQLRTIVQGPFWEPCDTCDHRVRCPIKHNIDTFRDPTYGPATTERLRVLVDLIRLRRRRHLTMRDVRSLISHLLFRDRVCEEIPGILEDGDPFAVIDLAYFQGPGGLGVPDGSTLERGAALLTEIDVALVANPADDYALAHNNEPRLMSFPTRTSGDYQRELIRAARARAGDGYAADVRAGRRVHEAARRLVYFERADDSWWDMLPYTRLREFSEALNPASPQSRNLLRQEVVTAVSMYEGMADSARAKEALWLATNDEAGSGYRAFRRFPMSDLELLVVAVESPYVETEPDHLALVHRPSGASLTLDIDLMEVLQRLKQGYVPSPEEGRGFMVNLALFKHRLLATPSVELMLAANDEILRIAVGTTPGSVALWEEAS